MIKAEVFFNKDEIKVNNFIVIQHGYDEWFVVDELNNILEEDVSLEQAIAYCLEKLE